MFTYFLNKGGGEKKKSFTTDWREEEEEEEGDLFVFNDTEAYFAKPFVFCCLTLSFFVSFLSFFSIFFFLKKPLGSARAPARSSNETSTHSGAL